MTKEMKIRIYSPEHSKAVQERLFEMGYSWVKGGKTLIEREVMYYIATNKDSFLSRGSKGMWEGYKNDGRPECTLDDLYKPSIEEIMQECIKRFPKGSVVKSPENEQVFTVSTEDYTGKGVEDFVEGVYYCSKRKDAVLSLKGGCSDIGEYLYYNGEYATLISKPKYWTEMSVEEWLEATKKLNLSWGDLLNHIKSDDTCPQDLYFKLKEVKGVKESISDLTTTLYSEYSNTTPEYTVEELTKLVGNNFLNKMTKEKIIEILRLHSYNITDQAGEYIVVVDSDDWEKVAEYIIKLK